MATPVYHSFAFSLVGAYQDGRWGLRWCSFAWYSSNRCFDLYCAHLAVLQVLAIPAIPLTMSAGLLFGPTIGTVLCSLSGTVRFESLLSAELLMTKETSGEIQGHIMICPETRHVKGKHGVNL